MNPEQVKSLIRQAMLFIAGLVAGTSFVSKFFTVEQVTAIFTSETVLSLLASIVTGGIASFWALLSRTNKNIVVAANNLPEVAGVITKPTVEGRDLANAVPSETVVPATTTKAAEIARAT